MREVRAKPGLCFPSLTNIPSFHWQGQQISVGTQRQLPPHIHSQQRSTLAHTSDKGPIMCTVLTMYNSQGQDPSSAGSRDPVKNLTNGTACSLLDSQEELDEHQATDAPSIQTQEAVLTGERQTGMTGSCGTAYKPQHSMGTWPWAWETMPVTRTLLWAL